MALHEVFLFIEVTAKLQAVPEPLLPDQLDVGLPPLVEPLRIMHLISRLRYVARAQEVCDVHWPLQFFAEGPAVRVDELVDLDAPVDVVDAGDADDDAGEDWVLVVGEGLGVVSTGSSRV